MNPKTRLQLLLADSAKGRRQPVKNVLPEKMGRKAEGQVKIRPDPLFTVEDLKSRIHYNPESGVFVRLSNNLPTGFRNGSSKYLMIYVFGKPYRASRMAMFYMTGRWPKLTVDHINGNARDDRYCNLREISMRDQCANKICHRAGHLVGTTFSRRSKINPWMARITIQKTKYSLGAHPTQERAHEAYLLAKQIVGISTGLDGEKEVT